MSLIDDRMNQIAEEWTLALKKPVESHLQMHEVKLDALAKAVNLLARLLVFNGVIHKEDLAGNIEVWAQQILSAKTKPEAHQRCVEILFRYYLETDQSEDSNEPKLPPLTVIEGGKQDE